MDVVGLIPGLLGPVRERGATIAAELASGKVLGRVLVNTTDRSSSLVRKICDRRGVEPIQGNANVRREETGLRVAWGVVLAEVSGAIVRLRVLVAPWAKLTMRRVSSKMHLCHVAGILRGFDEVLVPVAGTRASK